MKRYELVEFNRELMQRLHKNSVKLDDYRYITLVHEYKRIIDSGEKRTFAIAKAAELCGIKSRQAYTVLQRLCAECNATAPE